MGTKKKSKSKNIPSASATNVERLEPTIPLYTWIAEDGQGRKFDSGGEEVREERLITIEKARRKGKKSIGEDRRKGKKKTGISKRMSTSAQLPPDDISSSKNQLYDNSTRVENTPKMLQEPHRRTSVQLENELHHTAHGSIEDSDTNINTTSAHNRYSELLFKWVQSESGHLVKEQQYIPWSQHPLSQPSHIPACNEMDSLSEPFEMPADKCASFAVDEQRQRKRKRLPSLSVEPDDTTHQDKRMCLREDKSPSGMSRGSRPTLSGKASTISETSEDTNPASSVVFDMEVDEPEVDLRDQTLSSQRSSLPSSVLHPPLLHRNAPVSHRFPRLIENPVSGILSSTMIDLAGRICDELRDVTSYPPSFSTTNDYITIEGFSSVHLPKILTRGASQQKVVRVGAKYLLATVYFHLLGLRAATTLRTGEWHLKDRPQSPCTLSDFVLHLGGVRTAHNQAAKAVFTSHFMKTAKRLYSPTYIGGYLFREDTVGKSFEAALEVQIRLQKAVQSNTPSQIAHVQARRDGCKVAKWLALGQFSFMAANHQLTKRLSKLGPDICSSDESDGEEEMEGYRKAGSGQSTALLSYYLDCLRKAGLYYTKK